MRFLLRPGWLALTVVVLGFAFACYYLLAPWQFHRSDERDAANSAVSSATTEAAVPRSSVLAPGAAPPADLEWRPVVVRGRYEPAGGVLVRLRSIDGGSANEVLTPLRTPAGETVLIDRGYVRPTGSGAPGAVAPPPAGTVTLTGYQRLDEPAGDRAAVTRDGYRQVYAANAAMVGRATGTSPSPGYVQLVAGQPGVLTPVGLPPPDPNPSYSYAWQWLIFGLMAIGGWAHFVRLEYRAGRGAPARERARDDPRDRPSGSPRSPTGPAVPASTDEILADRYGRR